MAFQIFGQILRKRIENKFRRRNYHTLNISCQSMYMQISNTRSLGPMHIYMTLIHVSMMHLSMILDPDTCRYDAYIYPDTHDYDAHMYDAFIHEA